MQVHRSDILLATGHGTARVASVEKSEDGIYTRLILHPLRAGPIMAQLLMYDMNDGLRIRQQRGICLSTWLDFSFFP